MRAHQRLTGLAIAGTLFLLTTLTTVGASLLGAGAAVAAPYPPAPPTVTVDSATVPQGGSVVLHGHGYRPGEPVIIKTVYIVVDNGSTVLANGSANGGATCDCVPSADASGDFTASVALNRPGTAIITATGLFSGTSATASVCVLPPNCNCAPGTGAGVPPWTLTGGVPGTFGGPWAGGAPWPGSGSCGGGAGSGWPGPGAPGAPGAPGSGSPGSGAPGSGAPGTPGSGPGSGTCGGGMPGGGAGMPGAPGAPGVPGSGAGSGAPAGSVPAGGPGSGNARAAGSGSGALTDESRNKAAKHVTAAAPHGNAVPANGAPPNAVAGAAANGSSSTASGSGTAAGSATGVSAAGGQIGTGSQDGGYQSGRIGGNQDLVADSTTAPGSDGGRFATEVFGSLVVLGGVAMLALQIRRRRAGSRC
jgi:hypothetical protein